MKLWLDSNISLDLTREAVVRVEEALRRDVEVYGEAGPGSELENAANIIRAHLQHVTEDPQPTDEELLT